MFEFLPNPLALSLLSQLYRINGSFSVRHNQMVDVPTTLPTIQFLKETGESRVTPLFLNFIFIRYPKSLRNAFGEPGFQTHIEETYVQHLDFLLNSFLLCSLGVGPGEVGISMKK